MTEPGQVVWILDDEGSEASCRAALEDRGLPVRNVLYSEATPKRLRALRPAALVIEASEGDPRTRACLGAIRGEPELARLPVFVAGLQCPELLTQVLDCDSVEVLQLEEPPMLLAARVAAAVRAAEAARREERPAGDPRNLPLDSYGLTRTAVDRVSDPVFLIQNRRIRLANAAFCKMAGYSAEAVARCEPEDLFAFRMEGLLHETGPGSDLPTRPFRTFEGSLIRRDGRRVPITVSILPISWERQAAWLGFCRSEPRMAFFSTITHELRTPITVASGYSKLLLNQAVGPLNEAQRQYIREIRKSCERLGRFVSRLLHLRKMDAGRMELERSREQVGTVVGSAVRYLKPLIDEKRLCLEVRLAEQENVVSIDLEKIEQVMINLIENAVKFTPEGGKIEISTDVHRASEEGGFVTVSVSDSGVGIPPAELEHIFEEFHQASHMKKSGEGIGLGLAICRRIVEAHGGRIWAVSEPDRGSSFFFTLPIGSAEVERASSQRSMEKAS